MSPFDTLKTATAVLSVLLLGAFAMGTSTADAQDETTVTIEGQEADPGQATDVPVEATNFDGVGALKFEINYDPAVLSFPDGAGSDDIISGAPDGFDAELLEEGTIEVEFVDLSGTNPLNFGDGVLFNLTFSAFEGGRSDVSFTDNSRVTDQNGDDIAVMFGDGFVSEGVGTVSLGSAEGTLLNGTAQVSLSGADLSNVGSFTLEVAFDESVADFEGIVNDESGLDLQAEASNGVITIEGLDQDGVTLGQNFAELEFTFLGQDTNLQVRSGNSEVSDASLNLLDVTYEDGALSGDSPVLSVPDIGITPGTQIEVPIEASELRDIGSASVAISFNESVLTFAGAQNQINENFSAGTPEPGVVQIEGVSESGADPANNDGKLIDLLFTAEEGALNDGDSLPLTFAEGNEITNNDSPSDLYNTSFEGGNLVVENPAISFSRTSVNYSSVQTGGAASETVTITNEATEAATLEGDVSLTDGSDAAYSITSGSGAYSLGPGESQDVTVEYAPSEVSNPDEGILRVTSNDPDNGSQDISLTGQAEPVNVALPAQSLDLREGDSELRVEDVIANQGDEILITTTDGDGSFSDEEVVGTAPVEEAIDGGNVLVSIYEGEDASPVDHVAHVSTDGTVGGVVATSDRAPVYATAQFDFADETAVGETGTVTVDAVEILYEGEVGATEIAINLHRADRDASGGAQRIGAFVGISQEDLAVNEVHEDVAVDVVEPVDPAAENPERIEDTIEETGDFFAMAHRGAAGTDADGGRIPAQNPALATTGEPNVIGDFATVTVEPADLNVSVSRDFEGGAADPTDYELVAIPGSTGVDVAETVSGNRGTNWRAFLETGGSGGSGSLQSYGQEAFDFQAGRGVWVLAQNGWSFDGTVPAVNAADGTPSVPLQDGWNAISNPLQEDLVWADVRDASGLSGALFRWTGEGGFSDPVDTLRSAQETGEAYYTLNNEGAESLELVSSATSNSTLAANTAAEGESGTSSRTVELSATAGEKGVTSTVTVGMNPSAEEASSYRAPPAHFGGTALRIRDGDPVKSYMRMVAATDAETSRFDLSLQAEPGASVEVSADDLPETVGPNFGVVLVDGNDTYDLRDGPATVTVGENSGSAGFQVRLGDAEKIAQQTAPDETQLRANYPNPFSEQTTIEYDVAEQSEVNIRVYNVLGQQVATLARGTKQAGTHQVDWRGQSLSSGKYFVRLEAGGTTDTKQITIVR